MNNRNTETGTKTYALLFELLNTRTPISMLDRAYGEVQCIGAVISKYLKKSRS